MQMDEIFLRGTNKITVFGVSLFVCFFFSNTLLHDFVLLAGCLRCPFPVFFNVWES